MARRAVVHAINFQGSSRGGPHPASYASGRSSSTVRFGVLLQQRRGEVIEWAGGRGRRSLVVFQMGHRASLSWLSSTYGSSATCTSRSPGTGYVRAPVGEDVF